MARTEGGRFDGGANEDDYRWDVARAVIALANSIGGVVLLGVDNEGKPVGREASDPTHKRERDGAEAFRREFILQQVLHPKRGWRTGRRGSFKVVNPSLLEHLVTLEEIRCGEESALAILVDPVPRGYGHVVVEKTTNGNPVRVVYARKRGAVGQIVELPIEDPGDAGTLFVVPPGLEGMAVADAINCVHPHGDAPVWVWQPASNAMPRLPAPVLQGLSLKRATPPSPPSHHAFTS